MPRSQNNLLGLAKSKAFHCTVWLAGLRNKSKQRCWGTAPDSAPGSLQSRPCPLSSLHASSISVRRPCHWIYQVILAKPAVALCSSFALNCLTCGEFLTSNTPSSIQSFKLEIWCFHKGRMSSWQTLLAIWRLAALTSASKAESTPSVARRLGRSVVIGCASNLQANTVVSQQMFPVFLLQPLIIYGKATKLCPCNWHSQGRK